MDLGQSLSAVENGRSSTEILWKKDLGGAVFFRSQVERLDAITIVDGDLGCSQDVVELHEDGLGSDLRSGMG